MSLLARLIEAGTPADLIEEVAMLIAEQRALEKRRANDRQRQQEARERKSGHVTSRDVTDITECHGEALSRPPNDNNSNPPTHTPENKTARVKGHRLPDDWQPKPLTGDAALAAACWPPGAIERELARFRDWAASATGPNSQKSNWDAAWRNWIRKTEDDGRYRANGQPKQSSQRGGSTRDAAQLALSRMGYG